MVPDKEVWENAVVGNKKSPRYGQNFINRFLGWWYSIGEGMNNIFAKTPYNKKKLYLCGSEKSPQLALQGKRVWFNNNLN